jgi:acetoacetate decarboxylase
MPKAGESRDSLKMLLKNVTGTIGFKGIIEDNKEVVMTRARESLVLAWCPHFYGCPRICRICSTHLFRICHAFVPHFALFLFYFCGPH